VRACQCPPNFYGPADGISTCTACALGTYSPQGSTASTACGGGHPLVTISEDGTGSTLFPGSSVNPMPGVRASDQGPGGLASALSFDLGGPPSLVGGDLVLFDETSQLWGDWIRFNPADTGTIGYPASVVFYSLRDTSAAAKPADTGLPTAVYLSLFGMDDVQDVYYTPTSSQPGYVAGFRVTYHIIP
jgi:hypothetical protein